MTDQILFAPVLNILFFATMAVLEGNPGSLPTKLYLYLPKQLKSHWTVWPAAQYVNVRFIMFVTR
jgi:hypothetical protein